MEYSVVEQMKDYNEKLNENENNIPDLKEFVFIIREYSRDAEIIKRDSTKSRIFISTEITLQEMLKNVVSIYETLGYKSSRIDFVESLLNQFITKAMRGTFYTDSNSELNTHFGNIADVMSRFVAGNDKQLKENKEQINMGFYTFRKNFDDEYLKNQRAYDVLAMYCLYL